MRVIRDNPGQQLLTAAVVTIGNFDAIHLGHQSLIRQCKTLAADERPVAVVTFEPLPMAFFRPESAPARLMSVRQKLKFLEGENIDLAWFLRFNRQLAAKTADEFVQQVLIDTLDVADVVVGEDFHYGRGREGNINTLKRAGDDNGFRVHTVSMLDIDGQRVSSTNIRECLATGDLERAETLLGRPYRMSGRVIMGKQLGRKLGYPTANMRLAALPSPLLGVFAVRARWQGSDWRNGVANLGTRPAVGGNELLLETHVFDYDGDLYGKRFEVEFVRKLRDEMHFEDIGDLVTQMREDERQARKCLAQNEN